MLVLVLALALVGHAAGVSSQFHLLFRRRIPLSLLLSVNVSLKSAAAPGDPGDDSDDELDEPSESKPWRGDPPLRNPKQNDRNCSCRSGSGKRPACFGRGPTGYLDDGGNGGNGSDDNSHHSC